MQPNATLQYALQTYSFVLPINGIPHTTAAWATMIRQQYDDQVPRTKDVLASIEQCPPGTTITRGHGGCRVVLTVPSLEQQERMKAAEAGFRVEIGGAEDGSLAGRWWWTLAGGKVKDIETSAIDFATEDEAWTDAVTAFKEDRDLALVH